MRNYQMSFSVYYHNKLMVTNAYMKVKATSYDKAVQLIESKLGQWFSVKVNYFNFY